MPLEAALGPFMGWAYSVIRVISELLTFVEADKTTLSGKLSPYSSPFQIDYVHEDKGTGFRE